MYTCIFIYTHTHTHTCMQVMLDAVIGIRMLRVGGRVIFDDYHYYDEMFEAINAFYEVYTT